jgi:hypothetical protein
MTIVNDDSSVVNKLEASLTDDTRVLIYDHHIFIVQATDLNMNEDKTHLEEKKRKKLNFVTLIHTFSNDC